MTTGEVLKEKRLQKGLSLLELSRLCGIRDTTLRKYENGDRNPKIETLEKIAKAYGCTVVELLATGEKNGILTFESGEHFEVARKDLDNRINAEDNAYIAKLRIPALKLNDAGRDLLLNDAEKYAKIKELTE